MLAIQKYTNTINCYLNANTPKYIVVHYVGAQSSTALNNCKYFAGGDRGASAHYFVDDNSIYQCIEDRHGAWHVGNTRTEVNNKNSLGIEMCCMGLNLMVTEKTEANTVDLVKYLMAKYNIPVTNVRTHYQVSGGTKTCPNWSANNWSRWNNFKAKLTNSSVQNTSSTNKNNLFRVIVNGKSVIALTGKDKAVAYAKANYPNVNVKIQCVGTGAIVLELNGSSIKSNGTLKFTVKSAIYNKPEFGTVIDYYYPGETVNYDKVLTGTYIWISYISYNGTRRYICIGKKGSTLNGYNI